MAWGTDSPHSLSLRDGDILNIHHLPDRLQITSHYIPSLTVAERVLKISGFEVRNDEEDYERGSSSVYRESVVRNMPNIKQHSTSKITESRKTSIKFSENTSKNKRKNTSPTKGDEVKRVKIPKTSSHKRRPDNTPLRHKKSKMTKSVFDTPMVHKSQKGGKSDCDRENSQFSDEIAGKLTRTSSHTRRHVNTSLGDEK